VFTTSQHRPSGPSKPSSWWMTAFRSAINKMGNLVMAVDSWQDPSPLKRAWCVLELHAVMYEVHDSLPTALVVSHDYPL
jgi:hypothetical protein